MAIEHTNEPVPVKPFLVYIGSDYYPSAGNGDLRASTDTLREARDYVNASSEAVEDKWSFQWWAIIDHKTMQTIDCG